MNEPKRSDKPDEYLEAIEARLDKEANLIVGCLHYGCIIPIGIFFCLFATCFGLGALGALLEAVGNLFQ